MFSKLILLSALCINLQQSNAFKSNRKNVICYQGSFAIDRKANGRFGVEDIDPFLCTHLVYAFLLIDDKGHLLYADNWLDFNDDYVFKFNALKKKNPALKTFAAVGGRNVTSERFSMMANDPSIRKVFIQSVVNFLGRYGFNGVDLNWQFPNMKNDLKNDDKANFVTLLAELKAAFTPSNFLLAATVAATEDMVKVSYNVPEMSKYLDIINIMSFNLHTPFNSNITGLNSPLCAGPKDVTAFDKQLNVKAIVEYWLRQGAPSSKLAIGIPLFGHTYALKQANDNGIGAPSSGPAIAGQYSLEPGTIDYMELCALMLKEKWTMVFDETQKVPYAYINETWVSYDDVKSIHLKTLYAMEKNLGGVMIWMIEDDDFRGLCGEKYPLLKTINNVLRQSLTSKKQF